MNLTHERTWYEIFTKAQLSNRNLERKLSKIHETMKTSKPLKSF